MDGWIVCHEHKDILIAAWDEEQEILREKEHEVRDVGWGGIVGNFTAKFHINSLLCYKNECGT